MSAYEEVKLTRVEMKDAAVEAELVLELAAIAADTRQKLTKVSMWALTRDLNSQWKAGLDAFANEFESNGINFEENCLKLIEFIQSNEKVVGRLILEDATIQRLVGPEKTLFKLLCNYDKSILAMKNKFGRMISSCMRGVKLVKAHGDLDGDDEYFKQWEVYATELVHTLKRMSTIFSHIRVLEARLEKLEKQKAKGKKV